MAAGVKSKTSITGESKKELDPVARNQQKIKDNFIKIQAENLGTFRQCVPWTGQARRFICLQIQHKSASSSAD